MFNREKTKQIFGYDLDPDQRRRTEAERLVTGDVNKKDLLVIDNCPDCGTERQIKLRQSRNNKPCYKCFHNKPEVIQAKKNQSKVKSEETKQRMKDNHWSTQGIDPWNKGQTDIYSDETKEKISIAANIQWNNETEEQKFDRYKKISCTLREISLQDFDGFSSPEGTRIRQSAEGKAWTYDVLAKANFTCDKCKERGGNLHAHHLNSFNKFPEQRLDPENGVCLCSDCHDTFHNTYGRGDNIADQYKEFRGLL
jgi:cytochrome c1